MTLTSRLSLFFLTALAAVLVTFSAVLYLLAHRHLHRQLDDRLAASAHTLASAAEVAPDGVEWEPHNRPLALASGAFGDQLHWAVTDDAGRVLDHSSQPGVEELVAQAVAGFRSGHRNPRRVDHAGRAWQVTRLRLEPERPSRGFPKPGKHRALELIVAVPLDPVYGTLRSLAAALADLTVVILVVALFASRAVCRRALAPVAHMAAVARAMGAADLTHRLPASASADELADLRRRVQRPLGPAGRGVRARQQFRGRGVAPTAHPLAALIGRVEVAAPPVTVNRSSTGGDLRAGPGLTGCGVSWKRYCSWHVQKRMRDSPASSA